MKLLNSIERDFSSTLKPNNVVLKFIRSIKFKIQKIEELCSCRYIYLYGKFLFFYFAKSPTF